MTNTAALLTLLLLAAAHPPPAETFGVAFRGEGRAALEIQNATLAPNTRIRIAVPGSVYARVGAKRQTQEGEPDLYDLTLETPGAELPAIAILGFDGKLQKDGNAVWTAVNGQRRYFRFCTSGEGIHFTVWSGRPLTGRRLWHAYHYLGYDTEPSCKPADYRD